MNKKVLKDKIFLMNHTINRKKMYKSGEQWVISSTLALLLLGGAEAINHTNIHATSTVQSTNQPIPNTKTQNSDTNNLDNKIQKPAKKLFSQIKNSSNPTTPSTAKLSNYSSSNYTPKSTNSKVTNQSNGTSSQLNQNTSSSNHSIPASAPIYKTKPFNSAYQKYMDKMGSTDNVVSNLNNSKNNIKFTNYMSTKKPLIKDSINQIGQTNPSDNHWIFNPNTNKYLNDNDINWDKSGSYLGLNYRYGSELKATWYFTRQLE